MTTNGNSMQSADYNVIIDDEMVLPQQTRETIETKQNKEELEQFLK